MGDLARVSYADMDYQRDLMKEHSETVNFILMAKEEAGRSLDKEVRFNLRSISQVRFKKFAELEAELSNHIRRYYDLGE